MFRSSTANFDRLLEKATSQLLLEPDWSATLAITDLIRGGEVPPKYAVSAIKKRFYSENPHVALYALEVMESCVKNCGSLVHEEVATRGFMEELRELVKRSSDDKIKKKVLEMIQNWGMAFRSSQKYRIVTDTLNLMKAEGWEFPPIREAEAMFEADVAPEWKEGEVCHRCRAPFGLMTRQHHCRACGQVFCARCSSRSCLLPKFGIEKEVRVCDSCYEEYGPKDGQNAAASSASSSHSNSPAKARAGSRGQQHGGSGGGGGGKAADSELPAEYLASSLAQQSQAPPARSGKTEEEIKEEEELQLALALSQSEAEEQEKAKKRMASHYAAMQHQHQGEMKKEEKVVKEDDLNPELMRYLNRDYWEKKEREKETNKDKPITAAGASLAANTGKEQFQSSAGSVTPAAASVGAVGGNKDDDDLDEFVMTLKTQVEIFVNRMKSNSSRGRSIANDSSVQTLFMNTMAMHSQLLKHIQAQEDKRVHYEGLQDKITQVKDARAALEALREEERERRRREAEEAERLRQLQMQEKLEVMRKKKQEYLQYQRQLALQRMQEQEREMMLRQEQAKQQQQQYIMAMQQNPQMAAAAAPGAYPSAYPIPQQQPGGVPYMTAPPAGAPVTVAAPEMPPGGGGYATQPPAPGPPGVQPGGGPYPDPNTAAYSQVMYQPQPQQQTMNRSDQTQPPPPPPPPQQQQQPPPQPMAQPQQQQPPPPPITQAQSMAPPPQTSEAGVAQPPPQQPPQGPYDMHGMSAALPQQQQHPYPGQQQPPPPPQQQQQQQQPLSVQESEGELITFE